MFWLVLTDLFLIIFLFHLKYIAKVRDVLRILSKQAASGEAFY